MPAPIPFGRYTLLERLAIGGMAEIFLAKSTGEAGFERICVIKRVLPHLAKDPEFLRMFLDEARIAARLHHPGIVQIHELGRVGDDSFIAMEYLAGEDVSALLLQARRAGIPVPLEVAAHVIAAAAAALHSAHEYADEHTGPLGIVHRDVSPSNLFVTFHGTVKVLDFGVARAEGRLSHTEVGTTKGKLSYMAPEQILGRPVDRRVDVWALGVCLHELVTGERLFSGGEGTMDRLRMVCEAPLSPPGASRPGVPALLDAIAMRALARDPEQRYATADLLRADLETFLSERTYVPHDQLLGGFLRQLFGDAHIGRKLSSARPPPPSRDSTGTAPLGEAAAPRLVEESAAISSISTGVLSTRGRRRAWDLTTAVDASPNRRRRGRAAIVVAVAVLLVASAAALVLPRAQRAAASPLDASVAAPAGPSDEAAPDASTLTAGSVAADDVAADASAADDVAAAARAADPVAVSPPPVQPEPARSTPVQGKRASRTGRLTVHANIPVDVHLDGRPLGRVPVDDLELPAGRHALQLVDTRLGVSKRAVVRIRAGRSTVHRAVLGTGTLNIDAVPWAEVWLDGVKIGLTPIAGRVLWEGEHRLRLKGPDASRELVVKVRSGASTAVRETLR